MSLMNRYRVSWTGANGGPGMSTFYYDSSDAVDRGTNLKTFFSAIAGQVPTGIGWSFPTAYDVIDAANGNLVGSTSISAQTAVPATGTGAYSAPTGGMVKWQTGIIADGFRVVGRTFLVPLYNTAYDSAGTLSSAAITAIQTAASALVTSGAGKLVVWHRPRVASATKPAHDGSAAIVGSALVPDECVVLRSRRD